MFFWSALWFGPPLQVLRAEREGRALLPAGHAAAPRRGGGDPAGGAGDGRGRAGRERRRLPRHQRRRPPCRIGMRHLRPVGRPALFSERRAPGGWAAARPAGPEPTTATERPLRRSGSTGRIQPSSHPRRTISHSTCLIDTGSWLMPRTHAVSQGAGQTIPVNSGKLFVE